MELLQKNTDRTGGMTNNMKLLSFRSFFQNLSFRKKITIICMCISLIPVIMLGIFSYRQMRHLLINREEVVLNDTLQRETVNISHKINSYLDALNLIAWNSSILYCVSREYSNNYEMYLAYRDIIDPLFYNIRILNSDIESITIYSDGALNPHGSSLRPLSDIYDMPWYSNALETTIPFFYHDEGSNMLYLVCQLYYKHPKNTSILCLSVNMDSLFSSLREIFHTAYGIQVWDEQEHLLYKFSSLRERDEIPAFSPKHPYSQSGFEKLDTIYIIEQTTLTAAEWTLYLYTPIETISQSASHIAFVVFLIIFICLIIITLSCFVLSKMVVKPLEALSDNMKRIDQGDLTITVTSDSNDEVGQLIKTFRHMAKHLDHLINEILLIKISKQELEMKALQAQINPHFLYNGLSLINRKAILSGQEDISKMTQLLSTFYRTTLNKGQSITTIREELKNMYSYIKIQQMMHSYSFDVFYDIDNTVEDILIPNLILQPLVENAIVHGLDHKETNGKGILSLSGHIKEQDIIFKIMDNGCGMSIEQCDQILEAETSGYGIQNVHRRIQLYYGISYGLSFHSTPAMGTCVTLRLPGQDALADGISCQKQSH